ncbi:Gluconolaconase [Rhodovastum atsumiense]|uniref:Gluconolaconase n=1 Tax=Rhodovastum atsumiense TaxID=504468 RepID=A0A5M6IS00_9PROT|nr:L-dopachrome tautomerase-related protein [Rhodovastum atsumiense]KAA5610255.1 gluconolaconase [Rhodovastum atsumiense]CAH2602260.1 Gluconolaconase [Rhodovastum atsumiense]
MRTAGIAVVAALALLPGIAPPPRAQTALAEPGWTARHPVFAALPSERGIGEIEPVFAFHGAMPTGVTVSARGRIFVNYPRWGDEVPFTVAELRGGKEVAYPDVAINRADPQRPGATLVSVQSVVVDPADRLWILDTAAPSFAPPLAGGVKLVAVDLGTNKVVKAVILPPSVVLPSTYVNDVRFDLRQGRAGVAYITDSSTSGPGGIIVVDLDSGAAWRKLSGHASTSPDPAFVPVVEGETLVLCQPGQAPVPFRVASDGIALSADGATLFYSPLSSRHLFSVPTALLRDRAAPAEVVARAVVDLGEKGASDGLEADDQGRIYAGDYEHNSIRQRGTDGSWRTIAHDPRLLWPDTLAVARDGYLYFTVNQLQRQKQFHAGQDLREKPYSLFRIRIGAGPVALR